MLNLFKRRGKAAAPTAATPASTADYPAPTTPAVSYAAPPASDPQQPVMAIPTALISLDDLERMDNLIDDLKRSRDDLPDWHLGERLVKSGAVLVGTTYVARPKAPIRLNIFVDHAASPAPDAPDPWSIRAIDRPASFVVADVYDHGDVKQYTLVEIGDTYDDGVRVLLDDEARARVRSDLVESYLREPAPWDNDELYAKLMDNPKTGIPSGRFWRKDASTGEPAEAPAESTISVDDPRFSTLLTIPDPAAPEDASRSYRLAIERALVEHGNSFERSWEAEVYQEYHALRVHGQTMDFIGKGQGGTIYQEDSFEPGFFRGDPLKLITVTNKGQMASGNVNLPREDGKMQRVASWVRDTDRSCLVNYLDGYTQPLTRFADFRTMTLYLFVTLALPRRDSLESALSDHLAEAHLDQTPAHDVIEVSRVSTIFRARNRFHAAHPSLAWLEAQRNFESLFDRALGRQRVERLYAGDIVPFKDLARDLAAERIWFDPFRTGSVPFLCTGDMGPYLDTLRKQFEEAREKDPENTISPERFALIYDQLAAAFGGDIDAGLELIGNAVDGSELPYRYEFSVTFDKEASEARINLFLPQKAVFPLTAANVSDTRVVYRSKRLSPKQFEERYTKLACALGLRTVCIVKSRAAWVTDVALSAWYHTDDGPVCLYSVKADEETLDQYNLASTEVAYDVLKDMGATMHRNRDQVLEPVHPVFPLHDGLDHHIGFHRFNGSWTIPWYDPVFTDETAGNTFMADEARIFQMVRAGDTDLAFKRATVLERRIRRTWLAPLSPDAHPLSCMGALDLALGRKMLLEQGVPESAITELPRGLARLYTLLGSLCIDRGDEDAARDHLLAALELDPAYALAQFELEHMSTAEDDIATARELIARASEVAGSQEDLSHVYRRWGYHAIEEAEFELADNLFSYALLVDSGAENQDRSQHELEYLRDKGFEPSVHDAAAIRAYLSGHGYPTDLSQQVLDIARPPVEAALSGGPLPERSLLEAYLCSALLHDALDDDLLELAGAVLGGKLEEAPFTFYLHKPILLSDPDLLPSLASQIELPTDAYEGAGFDDDDAGLVVIPYIDRHAGLTFDVVATMMIRSRSLIRTVPEDRRLVIRAGGYQDVSFYLLRAQDHPDLDFQKHIEVDSVAYATTPQQDATRAIRCIDHLRNFESPDDILVLLTKEDTPTEAVWMTLEYGNEVDGLFARLLNEPFDDFGIHAGDVCQLVLTEDERSGQLLAYPAPVERSPEAL